MNNTQTKTQTIIIWHPGKPGALAFAQFARTGLEMTLVEWARRDRSWR